MPAISCPEKTIKTLNIKMFPKFLNQQIIIIIIYSSIVTFFMNLKNKPGKMAKKSIEYFRLIVSSFHELFCKIQLVNFDQNLLNPVTGIL